MARNPPLVPQRIAYEDLSDADVNELMANFPRLTYEMDQVVIAPPDRPSRRTPKSRGKADEGPDDFAYYAPTVRDNLTATKIRVAQAKAQTSNPEGVKVVNVTEESKESMAGYLFFKDTAQLTRFMRGPLNEVAAEWLNSRRGGFDLECTKKDGNDPSTYRWSTARLFELIRSLTSENKQLIRANNLITHADLGIEDLSRDEPGYFSWLCTMDKVMVKFPEHFPELGGNDGMRSYENWYRCFLLLKCYWREVQRNSLRNDGKESKSGRGLVSKQALIPRFLPEGLLVDDTEMDDETEHAMQQRYAHIRELAAANSDSDTSDTDSEGEDRYEEENENYEELIQFYKCLSSKGDISKKTAQTQGRKPLTVSQYEEYTNSNFHRVNRYTVKVRQAKNVTDNEFLHNSAQEAEKIDSLEGLSKAEITDDSEVDRQIFFDLNNKILSASAIPPSFIDACGMNAVDPTTLKIDGAPDLVPYPHQIIDVAWLGKMERCAIRAAILAGECGSGKTITILMHILFEAEKAEREGRDDHRITVIFAPSSVVDVWYSDWQKYFSKSLICRMFYGRLESTDPQREKCLIPGATAEDFDKFLEDRRSDDPKTSRTFVITSYTTWALRCLEKKKVTPNADDIIHGFDIMDDTKIEQFRLAIKNKNKICRVVCDEAHLIKNPLTFAADSILRINADFFIGVTATPMINRITDMRGYLCQIAKGKSLGLNLPNDIDSLISIYHADFDPEVNLPTNSLGETSESIIPANNKTKTSEMVHTAIKEKFPIHILCPEAYRMIGNKSKWSTDAARNVLKPILDIIQLRRILSKPFETIDGKFVRPGEDIPHYTVTTVELVLPKRLQQVYDEMTAEWRRKLNLGEEDAGSSYTKVKQSNEVVEGSLNNEAYRGLMVATFDLQLGRYLKKKRKGVPIAGSDEVQQWSNMDDDHGVSVKFKKCRPRGAHYIPPPTNRIDAANVHMAESVKMQAMVAQLATWKAGQHRALVYFNWPVTQLAAEGVLVLLGFKVLTLCSHHSPEERRRIIALFRDPAYECDALLVGYKIGSYGLNFHGACSKLLIMEYPLSVDTLLQVFGRLHRLGQKEIQEIIIFAVRGTFDDEIRGKISEKYITKLVAEAQLKCADDAGLVKEAKELLRMLLGEKGEPIPERKNKGKKAGGERKATTNAKGKEKAKA